MADNTISSSFVKQFEADVHLVYQRMGSKLTNMVRRKNSVKGESTTFQVVGKGEAQQKGRNSDVPILNLNHSAVECTLADYYAGEFIDKLDELKVEHDERQVAAQSIAAAMGRKSDAILVAAMDGGGYSGASQQTSSSGGVTQAKVEEIYEHMGNEDVPDDGQRMLGVAPQGWTDLMGVTSFSDRDYVLESELPFRGGAGSLKKWFSFVVFTFSGWTKNSAVRSSYAWHKSSFGFASGQDVQMDITWQGLKQAHLCVGSLSQGACIIDLTGAYELRATES